MQPTDRQSTDRQSTDRRVTDKRVIITGGAGFIGSHVVDELIAAGNDVVVIDNLSTGSLDNLAAHHPGSTTNGISGAGDLEFHRADIVDADAMNELVTDADLVIHMAVACVRTSLNEPSFVHEANATGSLNVALAAQRNGVGRIVYVSSSEAYGSAVEVPMPESHPMLPTTVYGGSKLAGEVYSLAMHRTHGTEVVVIRPFNSYGPREPYEGKRAEVIPKFVLRTMAGSRPVIFGSGLQTRDFTWVKDTARGICAAAATDELVGRTVNIARGQEISIRNLAAKVLSIFGRGGDLPAYDEARPGDVDRHFADTTLAAEVIGWKPSVSIDEGLRRYVDWVTASGIDPDAWLQADEQRNW